MNVVRKLSALTEDQVHAAVVRHIETRRAAGLWWCHPPNGGARDPRVAARMQGLGVRAGVPDLLLCRLDGRLHGLELKASAGRLSRLQGDMLTEMSQAGCEVAVAFGLDEAVAQLEAWGMLR